MPLKLKKYGVGPIWDGSIISGQYLSGGSWYSQAGAYTTTAISVIAGHSYTGMGGNRFRVRWETASGAFLAGQDLANPATITTPVTIVAPTNAAKLYVYYASAAGYTFVISEGTVYTPPNLTYGTPGNTIFGPFSLSNAKINISSLIVWTENVPANTSINIKTAIRSDLITPQDNEYQQATNNQPIPNLVLNENIENKYLWIKIEMSTTDISISPEISDLRFSITGEEPNNIIQINLTYAGRLKHPQGNINVLYTNGLAGPGPSPVASFSENFIPVVNPLWFKPNDPEYILIVPNATLTCFEINYKYAKNDNESLTAAGYNATVIITNVGGLPL